MPQQAQYRIRSLVRGIPSQNVVNLGKAIGLRPAVIQQGQQGMRQRLRRRRILQ